MNKCYVLEVVRFITEENEWLNKNSKLEKMKNSKSSKNIVSK